MRLPVPGTPVRTLIAEIAVVITVIVPMTAFNAILHGLLSAENFTLPTAPTAVTIRT